MPGAALAARTVLAFSGPDWMDEPRAVADHYDDDTLSIMVGSYATALGALALIWFAAGLSDALRRAERQDPRAATLCFGGGVSAGTLLLLGKSPSWNLWLYSKYLTIRKPNPSRMVAPM